MKLVVGLGNPGKKYQHTRHNVGYQVVAAFATALGLNFEFKKKFQAEIAKNNEVIIVRPMTFMNESGTAVQKLLTTYNLQLISLLVVQDEIDLPLGTIRLSKNLSSAGHKGVESIIQKIGKNFARLRIGVENRERTRVPETEEYVLQKITEEEKEKLQKEIIPKAIEEIKKFGN